MKAKGIVIGICVLDAALIGLSVFLYTGQDRTVPVISFAEESPVYTENMDESGLLEGVTAVDDRDGDVSASLLVEKVANTAAGDVIVTYAAMDSSNNVAKVSRVLKMDGSRANLSGAETDNGMIESETERESESQSDQDSEDGQGEADEEPEPGGLDAEQGQDEVSGEDSGQQGQDRADGEADRQQGQENSPDNNDNNAVDNGRDTADARQADNSRQNDAENVSNTGNANGQDAAGNVGQSNEPGIGAEEVQDMENQAPVLTLASNTLTVSAGSAAVNWEQCIGELSDDTDGRLQLLANLVMDGAVDLNTPGTYPVTIYTRDSQGAESGRQMVNVHVE